MTRAEFRDDVAAVVQAMVLPAIAEVRHDITRMVDEDLAATNQRIDDLAATMKCEFSRVDNRLDGVEQRLNGMDQRLDGMDRRLDGMDRRLDGMDRRLVEVDRRLDGVDRRLDSITIHLQQLDGRLELTNKMVHIHVANPSAHHRR